MYTSHGQITFELLRYIFKKGDGVVLSHQKSGEKVCTIVMVSIPFVTYGLLARSPSFSTPLKRPTGKKDLNLCSSPDNLILV